MSVAAPDTVHFVELFRGAAPSRPRRSCRGCWSSPAIRWPTGDAGADDSPAPSTSDDPATLIGTSYLEVMTAEKTVTGDHVPSCR
jgi:hypothetical protein